MTITISIPAQVVAKYHKQLSVHFSNELPAESLSPGNVVRLKTTIQLNNSASELLKNIITNEGICLCSVIHHHD